MVKFSAGFTHAKNRTKMEFHLRFGQEIRLRTTAGSRTRVHLHQIYGIGRLVEVRNGQFERKCGPRRATCELAMSRDRAIKQLTRRASVERSRNRLDSAGQVDGLAE